MHDLGDIEGGPEHSILIWSVMMIKYIFDMKKKMLKPSYAHACIISNKSLISKRDGVNINPVVIRDC